ncbi:MAG: hypothetical protein FJY35_01340 [Betaproteobacteria bacterium]|nr:hypothetical protein [Betaproteobacteria bacterium]
MNLAHDLTTADSPMSFEAYEAFIAPIRARYERTQRLFGGVFFLLFIAACAALYFEEVSQGLLFGLISIYFLVRSTEASLAMDVLDGQRVALLVHRPDASG